MSEVSCFPYRWTLSEYVLRCALDADIRELLVEGEIDASFLLDALSRHGMADVNVFDADYVHVTKDEVDYAGFSSGAKARLLTIGAALVREEQRATLSATIAIVVDQNYDGVPHDLGEYVYGTDGYSIENYAINEQSVERFLRRLFGRTPEPVGAGGRRRRRRTVEPASGWLRRLLPPAMDVAAIRLTLRALPQPIALIDGWLDYFKVSSDGAFSGDPVDVARKSLIAAGVDVAGMSEQTLALARDRVTHSPVRLIRGRDYTDLFQKLLRSPWGKRNTGFNFATVPDEVVRRWIVAEAAPGAADAGMLVPALVERFARA